MITVLLVAAGGAAGAALRHWVAARIGPFAGLFTVNVAGSFALGALTGAAVAAPWSPLLGAGFCGALTTYSAFTLETLALPRGHALVNVVASVTCAVVAAVVGLTLGVIVTA